MVNQAKLSVQPLHRYLVKADGPGPRSDFLLRRLILVGDGTNNGKVDVYTGIDAGGQLLLTLRVSSHGVQEVSFGPGIHIQEGLYFDVTNIEHVLVLGYVTAP